MINRRLAHPFRETASIPRPASERGTALVELSLALPFLVALAVGVIDIGCGLREYYFLRDAVASGAEYAMAASPLTPGGAQASDGSGACPGAPRDRAAPADGSHRRVHQRVMDVIRLQNTSLAGTCIVSQLTLEGGASPGFAVLVQATGRYEALFPLFDGITITARARVPYLLAARP